LHKGFVEIYNFPSVAALGNFEEQNLTNHFWHLHYLVWHFAMLFWPFIIRYIQPIMPLGHMPGSVLCRSIIKTFQDHLLKSGVNIDLNVAKLSAFDKIRIWLAAQGPLITERAWCLAPGSLLLACIDGKLLSQIPNDKKIGENRR